MDEADERDLLSNSDSKSDTNASFLAKKSLGSHGKRKAKFRSRDLAFQPLYEDSVNDHDYSSLRTRFGKQKLTYPSRKAEQNSVDRLHEMEPFSLVLPRRRNSVCKTSGDKQIQMENNLEISCEKLSSGMILLKNYICLKDQVEIVNTSQKLGAGPGGFYRPGYHDGAKLRLQMMCLGRNWDPQTKYDERYRDDGSEAPPIPDELISLVKNALQYSRDIIKFKDELPLMNPDICIVNFYTTTGRLGLHQDRDESSDSLDRGLPVVSISIGDTAEFLYGDNRDVDNANNVLLESGDVLIFGGKSRHIFHGVKSIVPNSAPPPLLKETMLRPGRLNLTFRRF